MSKQEKSNSESKVSEEKESKVDDGKIKKLRHDLTAKRERITKLLSVYFPLDIVGLLLKFLSYLDKVCNTNNLEIRMIPDIQATFAIYESRHCAKLSYLFGSCFVEEDNYEQRIQRTIKDKQALKLKSKSNNKRNDNDLLFGYIIDNSLFGPGYKEDYSQSKDDYGKAMQIHTNCIVDLGIKSNIGITMYSFGIPKLDKQFAPNCDGLIFIYNIDDFLNKNKYKDVNRTYWNRFNLRRPANYKDYLTELSKDEKYLFDNFLSNTDGMDWIAPMYFDYGPGAGYKEYSTDPNVKFRQKPLYLLLAWQDEEELNHFMEKEKDGKTQITINQCQKTAENYFVHKSKWTKQKIKHFHLIINDIVSIDKAMLTVLDDKLVRVRALMNGL